MVLTAPDFSSDIKRLSQDFIGREWLVDEVDSWLKREGERFFILTGEPGVGKSALAAWLTPTHKDVAAYNFSMADRYETIVPSRVLRSLAAQLGENLPGDGTSLSNTIKANGRLTSYAISPDGKSVITGDEAVRMYIVSLEGL